MYRAQAEKAAEATLSWEGGADYEGGGTPDEVGSPLGPPGEGAANALVDALSGAMYDVAHTGAKRVAQLCQVPTGLACWALELLEEQACTVRALLLSFFRFQFLSLVLFCCALLLCPSRSAARDGQGLHPLCSVRAPFRCDLHAIMRKTKGLLALAADCAASSFFPVQQSASRWSAGHAEP